MNEFLEGINVDRIKLAIIAKAKAQAASSGEAVAELAEEQLAHIGWLAGELVDLAAGDPRTVAHFEAQVAAMEFQTIATGYLEAVAWRNAVLELLEDIGGALVEVGKVAAAQALKGLVASIGDSFG